MTTNYVYVDTDGSLKDFDYYYIRRNTFSKGGLYTAGVNYYGNLGNGNTTYTSTLAQTIAGGITWKQVSGGGSATAAGIKTDGTLWTWGTNTTGELGDNTVVPKSSPIQTIAGGTTWKQVSMGTNFTSAIKSDGSLWLWGYNQYGQLGDNTSGGGAHKSSPVQTIAGGFIWKQVAAGWHNTAAIKTDGTLWTWGYNAYGQLGNNTRTDKASPIQTISGGTNWKQVACGYGIAAIKTDGTLWLTGRNFVGQIGDNTIADKSSPVQTVTGGTNWKQVSQTTSSTLAIKTDGTLWLWGTNTNGELGDNTIVPKSSPVQTIAGGNNWRLCASPKSYRNSFGIKSDGTLWSWGSGATGANADGTLNPKSSPVQTTLGGTNWKQVDGCDGAIIALSDIF